MKSDAGSVFKLCLAGTLSFAAFSRADAAAIVTYLSGPRLCTGTPDYSDVPFCSIPGEIPIGGFNVPPPGGSYTDLNFGGVVRIMTGSPYIHPYALPSPISAHNQYLQVLQRDTFRSTILDLASGSVAFDNVPFSGAAHVWDANSDDVYYFINGAQILRQLAERRPHGGTGAGIDQRMFAVEPQ